MICTCNLNNLKDMSPAFVNRFDVVVLENQLENLNNSQYSKLISNIFNSFEQIPKRQKKININAKKILADVEFEEEEEDNFENKEKENLKVLESKEEMINKENKFMNDEKNMINKIILSLPREF